MSDEDAQYDMQADGLYVNFTDDEAASESRDMEPLPTGKYHVIITDVELRESKSAKNSGKPYYAVEFTVAGDKAGGQYVNRKCWTNAMLFSPALFTITHLMKALGFNVAPGRMRIPTPEELVGRELVLGGIKIGETKDKADPSKVYQPKFEPKSFFSMEKWNQSGGTVSGKTTTAASPTNLLS